MIRLTYDPILGVQVLYANGAELASPFDLVEVVKEERAYSPDSSLQSGAKSRVAAAYGQGCTRDLQKHRTNPLPKSDG